MRAGTRAAMTASVASVAALTLVGGAHALWWAMASETIPAAQTATVTFAAAEGPSHLVVESEWAFSDGGAGVTVRVPGELVGSAFYGEVDTWRFSVSGAAPGITGLRYDVVAAAQVWTEADGQERRVDVTDGVADDGTVLGNSLMTVFRAGLEDDCSIVPEQDAPADGEEAPDVYIEDGDDHVLQASGAAVPGELSVQEWCVALDWNGTPDGRYVNEVTVDATGLDDEPVQVLARWEAAVMFPIELPTVGNYVNRAEVRAQALDGRWARATDTWQAELHADPRGEPALELLLTPTVTNLSGFEPAAPADTP